MRFEGLRGVRSSGTSDDKNRAAVVGRIVAGGSSDDRDQVVELSLAMALQAVQRSLRQQGKPALQVSEKTLIAQLEAEGLLLDRASRSDRTRSVREPGRGRCGSSRSESASSG